MNNMKIYKSLRLTPIFNFFESIENEDLRFLMILDNYNDLPEITEEEQEILNKTYAELIEQYNEGTSTENILIQKGKSKLSLLTKKVKAEYTIFLLQYKYSNYDLDFDGLESELKSMGYNLNYNNKDEFFEALDKINTKGLDYKIKVNEKEVEDIVSNQKKGSYREGIIKIERALNISIDIRIKTMFDFFAYKKELKQIKPVK